MSSGSRQIDERDDKEQSFSNLAGKTVTVKSDEWYNLDSGRIVRKLKNRTYLLSPRVVGSCDQLRQFMIQNNLTLNSILVSESSSDLIDESIGQAASSQDSSSSDIDMDRLVEHYPQIVTKESITNLSRNEVVVAAKKWYNLETSRSIGNLKEKEFLISPRVAGPLELIVEFLLINNLDVDGVIIPESRPNMRLSLKRAIEQRRPRIIETTDIDQVSPDEINTLQPFNFNRVTVKARLTRVIDGDTFDCVTIIDPSILALPTPVRVDNRTVIGQTVTICSERSSTKVNQNTKRGTTQKTKRGTTQKTKRGKERGGDKNGPKMLIKLRIRLDGADAADCLTKSDKATRKEREAMRLKKEAATEFVRRWASLSGDRIWLQLLGYDCRSRLLGQLYPRSLNDTDMNPSNNLTSELLRYRDSKCGKVALPYDGTTNRTKAWKALLN